MASPGVEAQRRASEAQYLQAQAAYMRASAEADAMRNNPTYSPDVIARARLMDAQREQMMTNSAVNGVGGGGGGGGGGTSGSALEDQLTRAKIGLVSAQADATHRQSYAPTGTADMLPPELTRAIYKQYGLLSSDTPSAAKPAASSTTVVNSAAAAPSVQQPKEPTQSFELPSLTRFLPSSFGGLSSGTSLGSVPTANVSATTDDSLKPRLRFADGTSNVPAKAPAKAQDNRTAQQAAVDAAHAGAQVGAATGGPMFSAFGYMRQLNDWATRMGFAGGCSSVPGEHNFATGTTRVPGKGSPKVDKVPAVLAPGEAVLNAPAAEMAGRGLIDALNQIGKQQMGLV